MEGSGLFKVVLNIHSHFFLNNVKLEKKKNQNPNSLQETVTCSITPE